MERDPHYARIGFFVILAFLAAVSFFFIISKYDFSERNNLYAIYFDGDVTGLRVNEEVRYQGIPVGKVRRISVPASRIGKVMVLVNISKPALIRENSVAIIEAQGLTGFTFVQIRGSTQNSPQLKLQEGNRYPIIQSRESNISSVVSEMPKILMKVNEIADNISRLLGPQAVADLQESFKNLKDITGDLNKNPKHMQTLIKNMDEAATSFTKASKDLSVLIENNSQGLTQFQNEGLPAMTRLIKKSNDFVDNIDRLTRDLEGGPLNFLTKPSAHGYQLQGNK